MMEAAGFLCRFVTEGGIPVPMPGRDEKETLFCKIGQSLFFYREFVVFVIY